MRAISTVVFSAGLVLCSASAFAQQVDPAQLSANTTRLNAAATAPSATTLETALNHRPIDASSDATLATPTAAGNATMSIASANLDMAKPAPLSSMTGIQTSSEAAGNLHALTSTTPPRALGR